MDNMNKKILQAMQETNTDFDTFSEQKANALQLIIHSFQGTFRLTFLVVLVLQLVFLGLAVYCGYSMYHESDIGIKINWLAGVILTAMAFAIARLFMFMELHRLSVLREIKRIELQQSVLAQTLSSERHSSVQEGA